MVSLFFKKFATFNFLYMYTAFSDVLLCQKQQCLRFVTAGYREQLNQVTAYIDSSFVYGSDVCEMNALRSFTQGKLNDTKTTGTGKPLLPQITTHPECKSSSKVCFRAGEF